MSERIGVVGAGSWGTTLANLLAKKGHDVRMWSFEEDVTAAINEENENTAYLPGVALDERLTATSDLGEAVADAQVVLSVSPSQHVRAVMAEASESLGEGVLVVSASKGIETRTLETMAEVLDDVLPQALRRSVCFLSGPSFATEVSLEHPTAVTVAGRDTKAARRAQALFQTTISGSIRATT
jgi:glycerol-3-phosphate dehydrogenase (NAD(P)+)